jgi:acyl-CoA thioesterase-1
MWQTMKRFALFIVTCALLAGCTKSEPASGPAERTESGTPVRTVEQDGRPRIVVLGDSLAEGLGVEQGRSFPDLLQRRLDRQGYTYRVVNLGVSGDTTTGGLGRLDYALSLKPAILVIELGGNDGLRGIPVSSTKQNLDRMIAAAQKSGTDVLLAGMTLPPNYGPEYIRNFQAMYRDLARKYEIQLVPSLMQPIADEIESRPNIMQRDGIHPSAEGHELLADNVFRYLKPMLKKG